jgi:Holliday junction resolvase RusA-like endonuclease
VLGAKIKPKPAPRPRGSAGRQSYMPKDYREWKETCAWLFKAAWAHSHQTRPLEGSLSVHLFLQSDQITVWLGPCPAGKKRPKSVRFDLDNAAKSVLDALVDAGVMLDDSQVDQLCVGFGKYEWEQT